MVFGVKNRLSTDRSPKLWIFRTPTTRCKCIALVKSNFHNSHNILRIAPMDQVSSSYPVAVSYEEVLFPNLPLDLFHSAN